MSASAERAATWRARVDGERAASLLDRVRGVLGDAVEPCVVVQDLGLLRGRVAALRAAFPPGTLHAVAIKANPLVGVLRSLVDAGAGLEAASAGELALARAAGCPPERVVFDSPAKTLGELDAALKDGVLVNADSLEELARIEALLDADAGRRQGAIGLRVNPVAASGSIALTDVSRRGSKFGVDIGQRAAIAEAFERFPWLDGLHVHTGSQGYGLEPLARAVADVAGLADELGAGRVDIGGGLPTRYQPGDDAPSPDAYVARLRALAPSLFAPAMALVTEMGRALHVGCGVALSRVEVVKQQPDRRTAVLHVGADLLLRAVYHPDDWSHELVVLDADGRLKQGPPEPVQLAGPLCFAGDVLRSTVPLPRIEAGDWVAVLDAGGYTLSMWSRYCSRALPLVVGVDGDDVRVLRARESPDDLARFWSPPA